MAQQCKQPFAEMLRDKDDAHVELGSGGPTGGANRKWSFSGAGAPSAEC